MERLSDAEYGAKVRKQNKVRAKRYAERKIQEGKIRMLIWVSPEEKKALKVFLRGLRQKNPCTQMILQKFQE